MNFTTLMTVVGTALVGACLWFLAEYFLHRFAMHALKGKGIMSREHLRHHATATFRVDFTTVLSWIGVFVVSSVLWFPVGYLIGGTTIGFGLAIGWVVGYFFYEWEHARSHLYAPRNRYHRWLAKHHFQHHFGAPMLNQGVTWPIFDKIFGTTSTVDKVKVPRRLAMRWLLDENGEVRAAFADDYLVMGKSRVTDPQQQQEDWDRAFSNLIPNA